MVAPLNRGGPRSAALYARALQVTPGGVHSPVRALRQVAHTPVFVESARGCRLVDADACSYVDYCMAFGPLILGHQHPRVAAAVHEAIDAGWSYGTAERWSLELAEMITARIPWAEQLRFVNSGTEAVMAALRLARAATNRDRVLKFDGCYHGHNDAMLIEAGSGMAGVPGSAGLTQSTLHDTAVAPLDDEDRLEAIFRDCGDTLAAVIIEPLPANFGLLPQREGFLRRLRELCTRHGTLLIFDEVISGFRVAFGGCAERLQITPDLVTWGKVIGGGFPVGAYAGRADLMQQIAPVGAVYQAGTLSANPVAMRAGLATLAELRDGQVYAQLETLGQRLSAALDTAPGVQLVRVGSLFWACVSAAAPDACRTPAAIPAAHLENYAAVFNALLDAGVYLPPSPCEIGFLSVAHSEQDIDQLAALLQKATRAAPAGG